MVYGTELRRYRVRVKTHSGRTLPRTVVTFYGDLKAVALALEALHRQLGCTDRSVTAADVFVDDLGTVDVGANGVYALETGDIHDRSEF
jgi:hypothetical protein